MYRRGLRVRVFEMTEKIFDALTVARLRCLCPMCEPVACARLSIRPLVGVKLDTPLDPVEH